MKLRYEKGIITRNYPFVNMFLYRLVVGEKWFYPLTYKTDNNDVKDLSYGKSTQGLLSLITDYPYLGLYQVAHMYGMCETRGTGVNAVKKAFTRCVSQGLLQKKLLYGTGGFNGFYRGDCYGYCLTSEGLKFVKTFRHLSPSQEAKLRAMINGDGDKYLMHTYGTRCTGMQLAAGFQQIFGFDTELTYEAIPTNYFSQSQVLEERGGGSINTKKKRIGKKEGFFFDCMVTGAEDGMKWFVFGEYDRRTEGTGVLRAKLSDYCSTGGYINSLGGTGVPSVNNACILMACDSARGYHDGPSLNEKKCREILGHMGHGDAYSDLCELESDTLEEFNDVTGYSFDEEEMKIYKELLEYYYREEDEDVDGYGIVENHVKYLKFGYNPLRADTVLDREKFFTLKRLLNVLDTFEGDFSLIVQGKYYYDGRPGEVASLFNGLSCYFIPAVAIGYDVSAGVFCPGKLEKAYRRLAGEFVTLKGNEEFSLVSGLDRGGIILSQRGDFAINLYMRNTLTLANGYVHIEDLADLGAWLRVGAFAEIDPALKANHEVIVLADDEMWAEFQLRHGTPENIFRKSRTEFCGGIYRETFDRVYGLKDGRLAE